MTPVTSAGPPEGGLLRELRPLILFCVGTLVVLGIGVTMAARTLMASFAQVERDATHQKADQVYRAFDADLRQLFISNRDYSEWDDAQQFIVNRNPDFIENNFSVPTLSAMHVDLVWIVDEQGRDIHSSLVDRKAQSAITPAPQELLEQLRRFQTRDRALRERAPAERTIRTTRGLTAVSAVQISRSDYSQPTGAVMLFARFIAAEEIQRVRTTSDLPVVMTDLPAPGTRSGLPRDVADWAAQPLQPTFTHVSGSDRITGYAIVRDIDGRPVAVFSTDAPRDIYALGSRTARYLLSGVVVLLLAFGATAVGLVMRMLRLQKRNLSQRLEAEEQQRLARKNLARQAQHDQLTSLPNRAYLQARLPALLRKMADSDRMLAVAHIDLDNFKNVNDSRGHNCGDQLLQIVARRLRATVAAHDMVARMGGDEFVIVAPLMPDIETVDRFASRLLSALAGDMIVDGQPVGVTASIGIAVHPRDGNDMETLFKHADIALYQAKEAGRSCHRFFAADMNARVNDYVMLEQALRYAIGAREIYMEYQPIVDLKDGRVVSLEALMRWRHPQMGAIPPVRFIPVAEKSGLIVEMGQLALREVLAQQRAWLDAGVPIVPVAVNVSPLQLERLDFGAIVARMCTDAGLDPKWVRFEITESAMMKEPEKLVGTLRGLREAGSHVLIDDFGTGYSSLSYLDRLPVDILKIDRAFVRDLARRGDHSPIVDAVIDMARRLNLKTVAEGVETMEQAALLCERGCDYAQGFFYSKPVSAAHCRSLLEHLKREKPLTETMVMRVTQSFSN